MEKNKEKDLKVQTSKYSGRKRKNHAYGNREDKRSKVKETSITEDSKEEKLIC